MERFASGDREGAAKALREGGVLVFPTETVFGIGVRHDSEEAYLRLIEAKRRSPEKPISLMCSSVEEALSLVERDPRVEAVMRRFLPGELTVLAKGRAGLPWWNDLRTGVVGIRVPGSSETREILGLVGVPCLVTSANISSEPPARTMEEALEYFSGTVDGVMDGSVVSGTPSTIVDLSKREPSLVRQGALPFSGILSFIKEEKL